MPGTKAAILTRLQQEIFPLQGLKHTPAAGQAQIGLGPMEAAFPNGVFPTGAVHEFITDNMPAAAATGGFVAGVTGALMQQKGAAVWISSCRKIFPPALSSFGIAPDRIIFIDIKQEKHLLWALEEALKCNGLAAVIGELPEISFTASRRLQLAVEQSSVTGFLLRHQPKNITTTACVSRWKIRPLASEWEDGMPGVGFPRWTVELLKIRNGKPGNWQLEYANGGFRAIPLVTLIPAQLKRKTG